MAEPYTEEQVDDALTALIAFSGNATAAIDYLRLEGKRAPAVGTLINWARTSHSERFEQLRDMLADRREGVLANDYLDASLAATEAAKIAVEKAKKRLEENKDGDPARTAVNLASMAQRLTDKRLALQGRPQKITETRDVNAIMRGLIGKFPQLFGLAEEEGPKQLEGTVADGGQAGGTQPAA